jgi:small conductance mechanosensitive channel
MIDTDLIMAKANDLILTYTPKIILAIITLIVGLWIIAFVGKMAEKAMKHAKVEISLLKFFKSLIKISLKVMLIISVVSMLGINTSSFIAALAAVGFAIGMALQGSLSNFAGGILILFFKPFKVNDVIEAQGFIGKVYSIQILNTVLKTGDNKTVVIPNGVLSNGSVVNYTKEKTRRVDMVFGIGYDDDIKKAKTVLEKIVKSDKRILKDPAHQIVVAELADSSVNFKVRVWAKTEDYWGVFFDMQETVKLTFDKNNISIPYPQRDVHMKK